MLVGVDQKDIVPVTGQPSGDIHCQCGFAHATLLIEKEITTKTPCFGKCVNTQTTKGSTSVRIAQRIRHRAAVSFGLKRDWFKELDKSIKSASHALYPSRVEAWIDHFGVGVVAAITGQSWVGTGFKDSRWCLLGRAAAHDQSRS